MNAITTHRLRSAAITFMIVLMNIAIAEFFAFGVLHHYFPSSFSLNPLVLLFWAAIMAAYSAAVTKYQCTKKEQEVD